MAWEARAKTSEIRASDAVMVFRWVEDVAILLVDAELVIVEEVLKRVLGTEMRIPDWGCGSNGGLQRSIAP